MWSSEAAFEQLYRSTNAEFFFAKRVKDGRHHVFWNENNYECDAEYCKESEQNDKEMEFVCTNETKRGMSCRSVSDIADDVRFTARSADEPIILSTDGSHAFFPISGIAMAKNAANEWGAKKRIDTLSDTIYCMGNSDSRICQKSHSFSELKKLCRSNPNREFCTFVDDDGKVLKSDLGIIYYLNMERYLNNLGMSIEDDSDESRKAKEHFKEVTEGLGGATSTYVQMSLYRAHGNIAHIPMSKIRDGLARLYADSHPMLHFKKEREDCRPCSSQKGYEIIEIGLFHDRQFATVCYNGVTLRMYRSFSGCLWHLMIMHDHVFVKHRDSYTTGLLMDMELQRQLARYQLKMTAPLKARCSIEFDDEEEESKRVLESHNKGDAKNVLHSLEKFASCGNSENNIEFWQQEATARNLTSAQNIIVKKIVTTLTYEKKGNVFVLTKSDEEGKIFVRRAYPMSVLENHDAEGSVTNVQRGVPVNSEEDPVWLFLIDDNFCVLNNEFGSMGSPYRMIQSLINYEMDKLYECNLDKSQFLYTDVMCIEMFAAWQQIPFKMNKVELKGRRPEIPDLQLFYVEYTLSNFIRLPCFVQPSGGETLHDKYRIYESVIPGGLWLCKPFEYKEQTYTIPFQSMLETGSYFHVGQELNGMWPFHVQTHMR